MSDDNPDSGGEVKSDGWDGVDRRKLNLPPPHGVDRRQGGKQGRKKSRGGAKRELYLDMIQRERALLLETGVSRTTDQLLQSAGVISQRDDNDATGKDTATGDQLRTLVPTQAWMPINVHIIGLVNGTLKVAPLDDLSETQIDNLKKTVERCGFVVEKVETELWDRAELFTTLRRVHDHSADRCEKTLTDWLNDLDNGLMLNQFLRDMLAESIQLRASDIHLLQDNATDTPNWIRYRIDGDLMPMHLLPADAMARLTTLLKRDAGLNFGDRHTPKDGRFGFTWQDRNIDVRVAAGPQAQDGEKLTLRLLDRASLKDFDDLFRRNPEVSEHLKKLLNPSIKGEGGLIILSGPTGSGKTTTLYAGIQEIDRRRRHVLTIEDPIEYEMRYATQWQVGTNDFAALIRAAMRHDPDYIVVGEMRDGETVETALKAAESGHTVLSTIHADTAIQTIERLRSFMPVEREKSSTYTLSQQISCILNQRLIKTLCQGCSKSVRAVSTLTKEQMDKLELEEDDKIKVANSSGCDVCSRTGYLGRTLLLDALLIDCNQHNRNVLYNTLMTNLNDVLTVPGVKFYRRSGNIKGLVKDGMIDPYAAISQLENA